MSEKRIWHVHRSAPVRSDADSLFVAAADAPEAAIGDHVVLDTDDPADHTTGVVVEELSRDGERYFRLELGLT